MHFKTKDTTRYSQVKELLRLLHNVYGEVDIDWENRAFFVENCTELSIESRKKFAKKENPSSDNYRFKSCCWES